MIENIHLDTITVEVTKKRIKNLHLRVSVPAGEVKVSAPSRMSIDIIKKFVLSKINWIKSQQKKIKSYVHVMPVQYITGEKQLLWGDLYSLEVIPNPTFNKIEIDNEKIKLNISPNQNTRKIRLKHLDEFYKKQVYKEAITLIDKWQPIMNVKVNRLTIRKMTTRWGSCSFKVGNIRLNSELSKYPHDCLEYVLVHEMVHVLEHSHNKRFVYFMDHFMPDWRKKDQTLKSMAKSI